MRKKFKPLNLATRIKRQNKMTKEELSDYYNEVRKSAHVFKDKSKFDKKKSRQQKIEY